jgi:CBS domain-containing protein
MRRPLDRRMLVSMSANVTIGAAPDEVTVGHVMHPGVIVAAPESPLRYVARLMAQHRVHAIVVIGDDEEGGVWGIVSDTDLVSAILRGEVDEHTAGAMARTQVVTVSRGDSIEQAARLMSAHALTHLLVVAGTKPVGVISTLDLARAAAADRPDSTAAARVPERREMEP